MIDLNNVQAIVARGSIRPLTAVLLFRLGDPKRAKSFLREWAASTLSGMASDIAGRPTLHFLLSWNGLEALLRENPQLDVTRGRREFDLFFVDPTQAPD